MYVSFEDTRVTTQQELIARDSSQNQFDHHPGDDASEQKDPLRRPERAHGRARLLRPQQSHHRGNLHLRWHAD
jgi:hypothetical protein